MKLEVPAQLRGPETRKVMVAAIGVRKELENQFMEIDDDRKLSIILRVGGSLGTFGEDALENISVGSGGLECEVIIAPREWNMLDENEINTLVRGRVIEACSMLLFKAKVKGLPKCISKLREPNL